MFEEETTQSKINLDFSESKKELNEWVALDLETTGLSPSRNDIIEIGAVKFKDGEVVEVFSTFICPDDFISQEITDLTGITYDDVKDAPRLDEKAFELLQFMGDLPIVGQNIAFDLGFLLSNAKSKIYFDKTQMIRKSHDTSMLARFIFPSMDYYGLGSLAETFSIPVKPNHRATDDAMATGLLFHKLLQLLDNVPAPDLIEAHRFLSGTSSPLLNTLRFRLQYIEKAVPEENIPNPFWNFSGNKENYFQIKDAPKPDLTITKRQVRQFFSDLQRFQSVLSDYEVRPEQLEMADVVMDAFHNNSIAIVEAGTGVGKSMGYMIPALLSGQRVVVSTNTKNLQDQLFYEEIPRLGKLFKFGFTALLAKGRSNYVCKTKWKMLLDNPDRLDDVSQRECAAYMVRWIKSTKTGDLAEFSAAKGPERSRFLNFVASEPGYCTTRVCAKSDCFYTKVRILAQKADIVIVNHSLVFADIDADRNILGDISHFIFDEAHRLEDTATHHYEVTLNKDVVLFALENIEKICKKRSDLWNAIESNSLLESSGEYLATVYTNTLGIRDLVDDFFNFIENMFKSNANEEFKYSQSMIYDSSSEMHQLWFKQADPLINALEKLSKSAQRITQRLTAISGDLIPVNVLSDLKSAAESINKVSDALIDSTKTPDKNRVYWVEVPVQMNRFVQIKSAPLDVSMMLHEFVWSDVKTAVLTSATLSTSTGVGGFRFCIKRLGIDKFVENEKEVISKQFGTPFNLEEMCAIGYADYLEHPTQNQAEYLIQVVDVIANLSLRFRKGTLVLFTSYSSLHEVNQMLRGKLLNSGIDIFTQIGSHGRDRLVSQFKRKTGSILLGTESFWEGVDVPGKALEMVIIPKLPFDVPGDPIVSARIDKIKEEGRHPFGEYQLPNAILKMRQGAGRLIRKSTDKGVVLILDKRVVSMSYGKQFRQALRGSSRVLSSYEATETMVREFFEKF